MSDRLSAHDVGFPAPATAGQTQLVAMPDGRQVGDGHSVRACYACPRLRPIPLVYSTCRAESRPTLPSTSFTRSGRSRYKSCVMRGVSPSTRHTLSLLLLEQDSVRWTPSLLRRLRTMCASRPGCRSVHPPTATSPPWTLLVNRLEALWTRRRCTTRPGFLQVLDAQMLPGYPSLLTPLRF